MNKKSNTKFTDYYSLLKIDKGATKDEIKQAYMREALRWHPDKAETDEDREQYQNVYEDLQTAYKILSNEETRKMYADSQQNTFFDFRNQDRDLGYGKSDQFVKMTAKGLEFDGDSFNASFHSTRNQTEQEALDSLNSRTTDAKVTNRDYEDIIAKREADNALLKTEDGEAMAMAMAMAQDDGSTFNRMFDYMKAKQPCMGLEEYHGEPMSMFSTGGLVEDDGMSGITMGNGFSFSNQRGVSHLVHGTCDNPDSNLDLQQFMGQTGYGREEAMSREEMEARMLAAQQDREKLARLDKTQFSTEPSEIEKMYSGLFTPAQIEGLEAPIGIASDPDLPADDESPTPLQKKIALKKRELAT